MENNVTQLYQQGLSARAVGEKLGVSTKSVYSLLKRKGIPRRSAKQANHVRFQQTKLSFSIPKRLTLDEKRLCVCALALYWGEGAKTLAAGLTDIANSDVKILRVFLRYLREILHVDNTRLRVYLYCFEDQDVLALCRYWSKELDIPTGQFQKPHVRLCTNKLKGRVMRYGVAHVRYADRRLQAYVLQEIEKIKIWAGT